MLNARNVDFRLEFELFLVFHDVPGVPSPSRKPLLPGERKARWRASVAVQSKVFVGERVRCAWCFAAKCSANFCIFLRRLAKPVRRKITKGIYKDKDTKALSHVACMNSAFGRKPKPDFIYLKRCASFVGKACYVHSLALSASHNCFYQDSS